MPTALSVLVSFCVFLYSCTTVDLRITQSAEAEPNVIDQLTTQFPTST
jgi:hypothetical protein